MFIRKPFITSVSFVGIALLIFFSAYFTVPFIDDTMVKAIAEASAVIVCLMILVFGAIYFFISQQQKPAEKQQGSVTQMPVKDTNQDRSSIPMTG